MNDKIWLIDFVILAVLTITMCLVLGKRYRNRLHPAQGRHHHVRSTKFGRKLIDKHKWAKLVDKDDWQKLIDKKKWHELAEEKKWHQWISERKGWDRVDKKNWHKRA